MRTFLITASAALLLVGYTSSFAQTMTPQQYHKDKGPCACPDDTDKAGLMRVLALNH